MVTNRDTGADIPDIPRGLRSYFSDTLGHAQIQDLIFQHAADDQSVIKVLTRQYRNQPIPLVFDRLIHPARVVTWRIIPLSK